MSDGVLECDDVADVGVLECDDDDELVLERRLL
jgi:hypothetical protein